MSRTVACLALLLVIPVTASVALAQEESTYAPAVDAHRPGRWSMQFQVGPDFEVSSFDGAGLAVTKNTSAGAAWRLGLSLHLESGNADQTFSRSEPGATQVSTDNPEHDDLSVAVDLLRLKRFQPSRRIDFELGVGPVVAYSHHTFNRTNTDEFFTSEIETMSASGFFGAEGRLGAEVFLARSLSAHAHYGWRAGYERVHSTRSNTSTPVGGGGGILVEDELTANRWILTHEGVLLGLSVYL